MPASGGKSWLLERYRGALLGAALGDALGATVEFMQPAEIRLKYGKHDKIIGGGWLYLRPGQVTDDTEMSVALAKSLIRGGGFDPVDAARALVEWYRKNPVDIGSTCLAGIRNFILTGRTKVRASQGHAGNGAAMRMGPIALASYPSGEKLREWAIGQAHLTHNHPLSDAACVAIGLMVHAALDGKPLSVLRAIADRLVMEHGEFTYAPYGGLASGYVPHTMATVFHHLFTTGNFEDCLVSIVNMGQDADTTGAIGGLIAGAWYGLDSLPRKWLGRLSNNVREELNITAEKLLKISQT